MNWLSRKQRTIADSLEYFIENHYRPLLSKAIEMRYATVALFVGILMIMAGMLLGKHMPFVFFPSVPSDYIVAQLVMPEGTPVELTEDAIAKMHDGLEDLRKEVREQGYGEPFDNVVITIGSQPFAASGGPMGSITKTVSTNKAEIAVELIKREDLADGGNIKELSAPNLANRWRALIGPIAGVKELSFNADAAGQAGSAIDVQLTGRDFNQLREASEFIQSKLATYEGLFDIRDNYSSGKREIKLALKPSAQNLGLQQSDLGSQVRAAFYGVEAQRIQRGRDDIKVMVRYPKNERASVENLEELRIRTP
ncbi:MAG: efflux RND transporter permease subunit, partial [Verrucomicrobiota bacterium]|nr:efflux RND transporter permease subunit [Verrucomicrobiota bacterium]